MPIEIRLPRRVRGDELANAVENAMYELDGFRVSKKSEYGYTFGSIKEVETSRELSAKKRLSPLGHVAAILIPVWGWISLENGVEKFTAKIQSNQEYDTLEITPASYTESFISTTKKRGFRKRLKPDFEKLVQGIYSRLGSQPA
jgi:hypothetical protein